jgi:hypothetical protein
VDILTPPPSGTPSVPTTRRASGAACWSRRQTTR